MVRKRKRINTTILSIFLIIAMLLVGCKKEDESTTPTTNEGVVKVNVMTSEHPAQPLNNDTPVVKEIEKRLGVKINLQPVPSSDYDAKKQVLIATNNIPDIMKVNLTELREYADKGVYVNISEHLDKLPNYKKAIENVEDVNKLKINGDLYGFHNLTYKGMYYGQFPMIRVDILEELGVEQPTTFDELYQVLKQMKEAYPDTYPWTMRNGATGNLSYLAYAFGSGHNAYYEPKEDKYLFGPAHPEYKEVLTYLNKMYQEGLLDPNYASNDATIWQQNLSSGKSLFFYDNNSFTVNFNAALEQENQDARFDMLPVLANAKGERRNYMYPPHHVTEAYVISSKAKNLDRILEMFDWMYSEEGYEVTNFGIEGEHFTKENGEIKINEELIEEFKGKNDPTRAIQSHLGSGYLSFTPYADDQLYFYLFSPPSVKEWSDLVEKQRDEGLVTPNPLPPVFTEEETEKLKDLQTRVETIVTENVDKFILGDRSLDEYDKFMQELKDAGATEIEDIYNAAYSRLGE